MSDYGAFGFSPVGLDTYSSTRLYKMLIAAHKLWQLGDLSYRTPRTQCSRRIEALRLESQPT